VQRTLRKIIVTCLAALSLSAASFCTAQTPSPRQQLVADYDWKFLLGDPAGAEARSFSDSAWRTVDLPHDWSIEGVPNEKNPTGAGGGYFPAGVGWYRKTFTALMAWKGKQVSVEFEGVASNATVYLNGKKLGVHPYAYTSFLFDLTSGLDFSKPNVLAVRVDNSQQPSSRWYSGSGIYRHVRIIVTEPIHVAPWGVFVSTPDATSESATVVVQTQLENASANPAEAIVNTRLLSATGETVAKDQSQLQVGAGGHQETSQKIALANPKLWSAESPTLYRAVTEIVLGGKVVDRVETSFGVRSLAWSADKGLALNGRPIKLVGGSVHHDNGPLGAAAFDRAEERRVELLKAAGYNAVRTAHNPPSPAFLDACDHIGILVLDEPFDVWKAHKVKFDYATYFDEWWKQDISSMVLRDRNHPSIVIWGIGNEIPELEVEQGRVIGKQLADQVRSLDTTRPLTLAFPGTTTAPNAVAVFSLLDITGYNYNLIPSYAVDHKELPSRIMLTTESLPAKAFPLWQVSQENSYVLGDLTWTAMDYLGESGIGAWSYGTPEQAKMAAQMMGGMMGNTAVIDKMFLGMANGVDVMAEMAKGSTDPAAKAAMAVMFHGYPWHAANCGDLDLTGYRKPQSYYRDILWNGGDRVYATVRLPEPEGKKIIAVGWAVYPTLPSWNWPGREGKDMQVEVYAGTEKVRLYLNNKLVGEMSTTPDKERKVLFTVPYTPGMLKAVGVNGDMEVATSVLQTAGDAVGLRLMADRSVLQADGEDLSFVTVEAVDAQGRLEPNSTAEVQFTISGSGTIIAVGNGDGTSNEAYQGNHRSLFNGRALVVVRTSRTPGSIRLTGSAPGMTNAEFTIRTELGGPTAELR
jgi:beta-galactosidase